MPKLPAQWVESHSGEPMRDRNRRRPTWRDAPSVVGRGKWRCGICQEVIHEDQEDEWFEGERCHEECVAFEKGELS